MLFLLTISIILIDQLIKLMTYALLPLASYSHSYPYGGVGVFKDFLGVEFSINHMANTGAAWGILENYQLPLLFFRIVLIFMMVFYFFTLPIKSNWRVPLLLIISGAFGNVIDYFFYGHVIDMFHFVFWGYNFPIFNLADTAITLGIAWLIFLSWKDSDGENFEKQM